MRIVFSAIILCFVWFQLVSFTSSTATSPEARSNKEPKPLTTLGRYLFYDNRLSPTQTKSCASCHDQRFAFTDGYRKSIGVNGDIVKHNSLPLFNLSHFLSFNWQSPEIKSLVAHLTRPMFNDTPPEMGVKGHEKEIIKCIESDSLYNSLFQSAFPGQRSSISFPHIMLALSSFCRSIESYNSDYDRSALSETALKGQELFLSEKYNCVSCHSGKNFNSAIEAKIPTENFQLSRKVSAESMIIGEETDKFRIPTLRNLAYTAPYLHDGSAATLYELLGHYENHGASKTNTKSTIAFMPEEDKKFLVAFLMSLNDTSLVSNPLYSDPFKY